MVDLLRDMPIAFFMWANPILWLFLCAPGLIFWIRRHSTDSEGLSLSFLLSIGAGWVLVLAYMFGTDAFIWHFARARDPIPPAWENYLFVDGARNVFAVLLGWLYA